MSFNLKPLADRVSAILTAAAPVTQAVEGAAGVASPVGAAAAVILMIPQMITTAEELTSGLNVPGPQKLAAVKAAILGGINEINPALSADFEKAWAMINPVISMIVFLAKFGIKF